MPHSSFSVSFLLYSGFSNMVLACLLEPLRAMRDQRVHDIRWRILTPDGEPAESSSGLSVLPDGPLADIARSDLLIVVSGYGYRVHSTPANARGLRRAARMCETVLGADTSAWLLADAGLLDGRRATTHWQILSELAEEFPAVEVRHDRFATEGPIWTCGGASTALDLMLQLISDRFGAAHAFGVSTMFLHDAARQHSIERGAAQLSGRGSAKLSGTLSLMAAHIETPLPLEDIAHRAGLSLRTMNRLFRTELGMPPGKYYQFLRLSRARELAVDSGLNFGEIALRCGFSSASGLSKAFKSAFGYPLGKVRTVEPR